MRKKNGSTFCAFLCLFVATPSVVGFWLRDEARRAGRSGALLMRPGDLSVAIALVARQLLFGVSAFEPLACGVVSLFLAAIGIFAKLAYLRLHRRNPQRLKVASAAEFHAHAYGKQD